MALGQRHHAVRHRDPAAHLRQRRSAPHRLRAVEPHDSDEPPPMSNSTTPSASRSISGVQPVAASSASVSRPITSSSMPSLLGDAGAEVLAVLRRAARFGRDQPGARDALVAHLVAADGERAERALDRGFAEPPGGGDALAQPDDARECIDHAEAVAGRARHQQPAIIGAEIERGIGRPAPVAAVGLPMPSRRPPAPPGPLLRRPVERGVEAWVVPGLAAHHVKPSCRPGPRPLSARPRRQFFQDRQKCNSAPAQRATL